MNWWHTGSLLRSDASVGSDMLNPMTHGAYTKKGSVVAPRNELTPDDQELLLNTLAQSELNTLPKPVLNGESVPVFYMFVQSDGHQPTSSARMMEDIPESQKSATDSNTRISRPPLYTCWNLDSGSLEVVRGYRDTSKPEGKYYPRTWTEAPPTQHTVTFWEGTRYKSRRLQTIVHNPRMGLFELKHSPIPSPTVCPVRRLRGTMHPTKQYLSLTGTDAQ